MVAFDYGVKYNILRMLASRGCKVTILPAQSSATDALALDPDGRQRVELSDLQSGLWRIRVVWKAGGLDYFREVRFVSQGGE